MHAAVCGALLQGAVFTWELGACNMALRLKSPADVLLFRAQSYQTK